MSDNPKGPADQSDEGPKPETLSEKDLEHVAGGLSPAGANAFTVKLGQKIGDKHFPKIGGGLGGFEDPTFDKH